MKKKDLIELLKQAYVEGQESVRAIKLVDKGHARFDEKDGRMIDIIEKLIISKQPKFKLKRNDLNNL